MMRSGSIVPGALRASRKNPPVLRPTGLPVRSLISWVERTTTSRCRTLKPQRSRKRKTSSRRPADGSAGIGERARKAMRQPSAPGSTFWQTLMRRRYSETADETPSELSYTFSARSHLKKPLTRRCSSGSNRLSGGRVGHRKGRLLLRKSATRMLYPPNSGNGPSRSFAKKVPTNLSKVSPPRYAPIGCLTGGRRWKQSWACHIESIATTFGSTV